jgi:hypothetical protein
MMGDVDTLDPADQLRADIESAIEGQQKGQEPAPEPAVEPEPADDTAAEPTSADRERDEKGRFVAKAEEGEEPPVAQEKPKDEPKELPAPDATKTEIKPPPGFSVASKAIWDTLPQSVRDDIAKREQEVDNGFKRYSGLGKFAEEAERNGRTLQDAVNDYVSVENELKKDGIGGFEFLCQRLGWDPRRVLGAWGARYGVQWQQPARAPAETAAPPQAPPFDAEAMTRQLQQIARAEADARVQAMKADMERAHLDTQIAAFESDPANKYFSNVRQDMAKIVQAGKAETIKEAYEAACWLNPEIRAILINEANGGTNKEATAAASRSRNAAKAVGGAPTPGINPDASHKRQDLSLDEEIRAAIDAQVGAA